MAVETQNDLSQDNERETIPTAEHTEQSELPDIVPSTQTITHAENVPEMSVMEMSIKRSGVEDHPLQLNKSTQRQ